MNYSSSQIHDQQKERHFYRLNETSEAVWPIIEELIERQYRKDCSDSLREDMNLFLKKRLGKQLLRPYLARLAYELAGGREWKSILNLLAAVELFNISTYQSNICFDQKADFNVSRTENQYISSMFSLSLAQIAISEQKGMTDEAKSIASEILARCNIEVYEGQYIDINLLTLNEWNNIESEQDYQKFISNYIHRCELIGGATFVVTVLGALAAKRNGNLVELLTKCYRKFGIAAQIINDLADYIPESQQEKHAKYTRPYTSSYGDLRMGRLTYPTFILLKEKNKVIGENLMKIHTRWEHLVPTQEELIVFTNALKKMNIRGKVESLIRKKCWHGKGGIKEALAELKERTSPESYEDLLFIQSFIFGSSMLLYFQNLSNPSLEEK